MYDQARKNCDERVRSITTSYVCRGLRVMCFRVVRIPFLKEDNRKFYFRNRGSLLGRWSGRQIVQTKIFLKYKTGTIYMHPRFKDALSEQFFTAS